MEYLKTIMPAVITCVTTVAAMIGALVWIAKKLVNSTIASQRKLIDGALEDMRANTNALSKLSSGVEKFMLVHQERERTLFEYVKETKAGVERLERRR